MGGRVAEAERAAQRKLAESLGVSPEEAKKIIDERKNADLAAMSEAERAKAEAEQAKADAERALADARTLRHTALVERVLGTAGAPADGVSDLVGLVKVDEGADEATVQAAVDAVKEKWPALFAASSAPVAPKPGAPSSVPLGTPPPPKPNEDSFDRGKQRADALNAKGKPISVGK